MARLGRSYPIQATTTTLPATAAVQYALTATASATTSGVINRGITHTILATAVVNQLDGLVDSISDAISEFSSPYVLKSIFKRVNYVGSSASALTFGKSYVRKFTASTISSSPINRTIGYIATAPVTSSNHITKAAAKIVTLTGGSTTTLSLGQFRLITTTSSSSAALSKRVGRKISTTTTSTSNIARRINRKILASSVVSAGQIFKSIAHTVTAASTSVGILTFSKVKLLVAQAAVSSASALKRAVGKLAPASVTASASISSSAFVQDSLVISSMNTGAPAGAANGSLSINSGFLFVPVNETANDSLTISPTILNISNAAGSLDIESTNTGTAVGSCIDSLNVQGNGFGFRTAATSANGNLNVASITNISAIADSFNNLLVITATENVTMNFAASVLSPLSITAAAYSIVIETGQSLLTIASTSTGFFTHNVTSAYALDIEGTLKGVAHHNFNGASSNHLTIAQPTIVSRIRESASNSLHISATESVTQLLRFKVRGSLNIHSAVAYSNVKITPLGKVLHIFGMVHGGPSMTGGTTHAVAISGTIGTTYVRIAGMADIRPRVLVTNKRVMQVL